MRPEIGRRGALKIIGLTGLGVMVGCTPESAPTKTPLNPTLTPSLQPTEERVPTPRWIDINTATPEILSNEPAETSYLNKQWNMAQASRFLVESMRQSPISANGGEFSLLERLRAEYNFGLNNLYKVGWEEVDGERVLVQAGEALNIAEPISDVLRGVSGNGLDGEYKWTNYSDEDLWLNIKLDMQTVGQFPRWWPGVNSPSPIDMKIIVSLQSTPPTEEEMVMIDAQMEWLKEYIKTRPNAIEVFEEKLYSLEMGRSYFDKAQVEEMYTFDDGSRIEDVVIDQQVMDAVSSLNIQASGDITNLLIRAIPTDDAKRLGYDHSAGMRFSENYYPHWKMETVAEMELAYCAGKADTYVDSEMADALRDLQAESRIRGFGCFVAYGYRDHEKQWMMNQEAPVGAATPGGSEHATGLCADLYADWEQTHYIAGEMENFANQLGFVHSLSLAGDPPHYFYLDGVWPGLTKALMNAGVDVNTRYVSVQARLAVFRLLTDSAKLK